MTLLTLFKGAPPAPPTGGINPTLNYVASGQQNPGASASGCTNSVVTVISSGSTHDMGGAAASTPNGTSPAITPGTYCFWNDLEGQFQETTWTIRVDLTPTGGAGHYWFQQGNIQSAAGVAGSVWYAGLQTEGGIPSPPFTGKIVNFAIWEAVDAVPGELPNTYAGTFGGEGVGYRVAAPYSWIQGVTYTFRVVRELSRGSRWFALYVTPSNTGVPVWVGSIRAGTSDSSNLHGVSYHVAEPFVSASPTVATCPLLPRSTAFFAKPTFFLAEAGSSPPATNVIFADFSVRRGARNWRRTGFRYDLLDVDNNFKKTLTTVSEAEVEFNGENTIMRTARFAMKDDPDINWFSDRIQPWFLAVDGNTGEHTEYPLGIFLFLSPPRQITSYGAYREIEGYDVTQDLDNSHFAVIGNINTVPDGNSLPAAELITGAVEKIILNGDIDIPSTDMLEIVPADDTLGAVRQWELGSSRLEAVNGLLDQVGYYFLHTDGFGRLKSRPIPQFEFTAPTISYATNDDSWVQYPISDSFVQNRIWNRVFLLAENPASGARYSSLLTNEREDSPISVPAIGRVIWAPPETLQDITSQTQLDKVAEVRLQQGADLFQIVEFETPIEPEPESFKVVGVDVEVPGQPENPVTGTFVERGWTIACKPGGTMRHTFHRIVPTVQVIEET